MTYFQQYEQYRKRYEPGAIWKEKHRCHTVKTLRIVSPSEIDEKSRVYFRILESEEDTGGDLCKGTLASWSKAYMEREYRVAIDD